MRVLHVLVLASAAWGQTAPRFDTATIKRLPVPVRLPGVEVHDGGVVLTGFGLRSLIAEAFGVEEYQVLGTPDSWPERDDIFEIDASAKGAPTAEQVRAMARSLLSDRFGLKVHREVRELPAYDLVVGEEGPKMEEIPPGVFHLTTGGISHINFGTTSMAGLVSRLFSLMDRPVFDKTGLTASYDFRLDWRMDRTKSPPVAIPHVERLGLKLEPTVVSKEVVVIDHVDRVPEQN